MTSPMTSAESWDKSGPEAWRSSSSRTSPKTRARSWEGSFPRSCPDSSAKPSPIPWPGPCRFSGRPYGSSPNPSHLLITHSMQYARSGPDRVRISRHNSARYHRY